MKIQQVSAEAIEVAKKFLGQGNMVSSAKVALKDAEAVFKMAAYWSAAQRALVSLSYSVGVQHPTYIEIKANIRQASLQDQTTQQATP